MKEENACLRFILDHKFSSSLFFLLLFFLPTQLGKHFWPSWSFVSGIRIDYLSPTVFATDILAILFIGSMLVNKNFQSRIALIKKQRYLFLFTITLLLGIFFSKNPFAGIYGCIKLCEYILLSFAFLEFYKKKNILQTIVLPLLLGVIFESVLSFLQFYHQGSIGGLFFLFGERTFAADTPGIANASLNGALILRPYATLPHPNVLAGYLLIAMIIIISDFKNNISNTKKIFFFTTIILGTISLLLTLSRIAILLWIICLTIYIVIYFKKLLRTKKKKHSKIITAFALFSLPVLFYFLFFHSPLFYRFFSVSLTDESFIQRQQLIQSSFVMIQKNPLFGVGLYNYLTNLPNNMPITSQVVFLQPVHNIFLLIFAETGVIGLFFLSVFLFMFFKKMKTKWSIDNWKLHLVFAVIVLGMFDHYFLTVQQGQLLLTLTISLCLVPN